MEFIFKATCVSTKYCGLYMSHHRWSQEGCNFSAESFFDPIYDLDSQKKLGDLHMFNRASVCRKNQKY